MSKYGSMEFMVKEGYDKYGSKLMNNPIKHMPKVETKNIHKPDETRDFPHGKVELVKVAGFTFGLATFEPGWQWSKSIKPIAKTESCQASHTAYQISGRIHIRMDDGTEYDLGPGDVGIIPPGHDAWTVGNEPAVALDISGMADYAKKA